MTTFPRKRIRDIPRDVYDLRWVRLERFEWCGYAFHLPSLWLVLVAALQCPARRHGIKYAAEMAKVLVRSLVSDVGQWLASLSRLSQAEASRGDSVLTTLTYTFNEADARSAHDEWGANCGPCALAFALQLKPDDVRDHIPDFAERKYTSPTMMAAALESLGRKFVAVRNPHGGRKPEVGHVNMFAGPTSLVRIQWTGPWTADGRTQKWAARQTHWIVCWSNSPDVWLVFDVNGAIQRFWIWKRDIVPLIVKDIQRADGGWFPANVWRLSP